MAAASPSLCSTGRPSLLSHILVCHRVRNLLGAFAAECTSKGRIAHAHSCLDSLQGVWLKMALVYLHVWAESLYLVKHERQTTPHCCYE